VEAVKGSGIGSQSTHRTGILFSANNLHTHVYGVIFDKGTTDGFLALPLTVDSTEFFIAAWKLADISLLHTSAVKGK